MSTTAVIAPKKSTDIRIAGVRTSYERHAYRGPSGRRLAPRVRAPRERRSAPGSRPPASPPAGAGAQLGVRRASLPENPARRAHLVWTGALVGEGFAEQRWKASIAPGGKREIE